MSDKQICPCCNEEFADLGWHNNDYCKPIIDVVLKRCRELNHSRRDIDVGPQNRGLEHVVTCPVCKFVYRYDSSD